METEALLTLLSRGAGKEYIGESISQIEHALQAANAAKRAMASETLIIASLLHDIGHLSEEEKGKMPGLGKEDHEHLGADIVRAAGLNDDIAQLVEMHVDAKRYLVTSNSDYATKLSSASKATLDLQGGAMTPNEADAFKGHRLFKDALKLRSWDDAAKRQDTIVPGLEHYRAMMRRNQSEPLSKAELLTWTETGFLHLPGWFNEDEMTRVTAVTDEVECWPEIAGKWMKYFESDGEHNRQLCRIENFLEHSPLYNQICRSSATLNLLSTLMGEQAELFKEKINFKLPGGQGFSPHQDAPAFGTFGQRYHITMMLSIDATTKTNGCLEIDRREKQHKILEMNPDLTLTQAEVNACDWVAIETSPGDLVLFDSYLPHHSRENRSNAPRRALYATYNRQSEGSWRDAYYKAKRSSFPPDAEREPGKVYTPGVFNVGNPIKNK